MNFNTYKKVFNCKLSTASSIARFEHDSSDYQHLKYKNGLSLVSLENDSNIVKLSVIHCAGSKHETDENYGITHRIRQSAYLGCKDISYFSLNRILQQLGGNLSIQTDREFIIYNLTCLRENLPKLSKCLFESAFNPGFKSWEIRDSAKFLKFDLEKHEKNIDSLLYEGIHTAAFRNEALGNSLFSTNYKYDSFNTEQMQKYIQSHYSNNNTAIFGDGISQTDLIHLCQENGQIETFHNFSDITTEKTTDITKNFIEPKSKYFGGSLRLGFDCDTVYAIVAGKANSPGTVYSLKGAINQLLLSYIISPPNRVKYSTNYNYPIGKLVAESTNLPYLVENFISIYSDQALVGFSVAVDQKDIEPVIYFINYNQTYI
ncbi:Complex III subunit 2 [Intoshia linei]|uniref:Complex III subunit 2 n=1 Tax=Intoshia linei TaxID=1819745 RepID=A0A177B5V9_9BILA|nr:Complex III subunit 2 [Intoshia linei]